MKLSFQALAACFLLSAAGLVAAQEAARNGVVPPPTERTGQPVLSIDHPLATPPPPPAESAMTRHLNKFGLGCNAHHTWFGCGSFRSEMTFIFGSCRTFFGEPCFPKPPQVKESVAGRGLFGREPGAGGSLLRRALGCSSCQ